MPTNTRRITDYRGSSAETCRANGISRGAVLRGDEGYGPDTIRVDYIGADIVIAVMIESARPSQQLGTERTWALSAHRNWEIITDGRDVARDPLNGRWQVVADRDRGDDPQNWDRVEDGDRVVVKHEDGQFWPVRIERPAPILDEALEDARNRAESWLLWAESGTDDGRRGDAAAFRLLLGNPVAQPLTREQIATAICRPGDTSKWPLLGITEYCGTCWTVAEGLLGLPQNGADRG